MNVKVISAWLSLGVAFSFAADMMRGKFSLVAALIAVGLLLVLVGSLWLINKILKKIRTR